jgi:hypothetical protein
MNNLQKLESKRLLKELEFYESDYEYKSELVTHVETTFIQSVNEYLEEHPTLKDAFDEKINKRIEETINKKILTSESIEQDVFSESEDDQIESKIENPKLRKLYREIVKQTHPDKIKNDKLNNLYIEAGKSYDSEDLFNIYSICDELGIIYELEESENYILKDKIKYLQDKINFIQSTFTWQWYYTEEEIEKSNIIREYVKKQII